MNPFQKITHGGHAAPDHTESDSETHPSSILTDTLPNINTTEDWAAAFGFPRNSETGAGNFLFPMSVLKQEHEEGNPTSQTWSSLMG